MMKNDETWFKLTTHICLHTKSFIAFIVLETMVPHILSFGI